MDKMDFPSHEQSNPKPFTSWTDSDDGPLKFWKCGWRWTDGHMDEIKSAEAWCKQDKQFVCDKFIWDVSKSRLNWFLDLTIFTQKTDFVIHETIFVKNTNLRKIYFQKNGGDWWRCWIVLLRHVQFSCDNCFLVSLPFVIFRDNGWNWMLSTIE